MKLTDQQKMIVYLANNNCLRQYKDTRDFYYSVSTETRRSGQYIVKRSTIDKLKKEGFITVDI